MSTKNKAAKAARRQAGKSIGKGIPMMPLHSGANNVSNDDQTSSTVEVRFVLWDECSTANVLLRIGDDEYNIPQKQAKDHAENMISLLASNGGKHIESYAFKIGSREEIMTASEFAGIAIQVLDASIWAEAINNLMMFFGDVMKFDSLQTRKLVTDFQEYSAGLCGADFIRYDRCLMSNLC